MELTEILTCEQESFPIRATIEGVLYFYGSFSLGPEGPRVAGVERKYVQIAVHGFSYRLRRFLYDLHLDVHEDLLRGEATGVVSTGDPVMDMYPCRFLSLDSFTLLTNGARVEIPLDRLTELTEEEIQQIRNNWPGREDEAVQKFAEARKRHY